jgi:hypothetical protein
MPAVQRESWWGVLRGLALALVLAVLLLHVAMPRVRVSPGDHLCPGNPVKPPRIPGKPYREHPGGTSGAHDPPSDSQEEGETATPEAAGSTTRPEPD